MKPTRSITPSAMDSTSSTLQVEPPSETPCKKTEKHKKKREMAHDERHNGHGDVVRDVIIGFADGLTVPFALTAGLSSYVSSPSVEFEYIMLTRTDLGPPNWSLSEDWRNCSAAPFPWVSGHISRL